MATDIIRKRKPNGHRRIQLAILCLFVVLAAALTYNDFGLYHQTIGKITSVRESQSSGGKKEPTISQTLTLQVMNGSHKGETVRLTNEYSRSKFETSRYYRGECLFITLHSKVGNTGVTVDGVKRDVLWAMLLAAFLALLFLTAGRRSALILASLAMNVAVFVIGLNALIREDHTLLLTSVIALAFIVGTMVIQSGFSKVSLSASAASLVTVAASALIYEIVLHFTKAPSFEFQSYAMGNESLKSFFLTSLVFGILGAVMDVAVTICSSVHEITETADNVSIGQIRESIRGISDDIMGTMINVLFFTFFCSGIPLTVLKIRNDYSFVTLMKYGTELDMIRFLVGAIGIVLAIPVSGAASVWIHRKKIRFGKEAVR